MTPFTDLFAVIYQTTAPIFLIIGVSMLVARYRPLNAQTLSRITIYIFSPALILSNIADSGLGTAEMSSILLASIVVCTLMALIGAGLARLLGFDRRVAAAFTLAAFLMNSVNFGLPFIEFAFGPEGLEPAVIFTVGQALTAYLFGTYVASRGKSSVKTAVRNVLTIPMPYAFVLAMILNATGTPLPQPIDRAAHVLAAGIIPAALVLLGLQLGTARFVGKWKPIAWAVFTRFVIGAAVAWGVARLFGFTGLTMQVFVLEAAMPAGILSGVLTTEFGGDAEFATAVILTTTLSSAIFLSGLLLLLT